jgi:hypothetical protein
MTDARGQPGHGRFVVGELPLFRNLKEPGYPISEDYAVPALVRWRRRLAPSFALRRLDRTRLLGFFMIVPIN